MSTYDIKGKYAIITGAGSGICLAFAVQLLEGGCSVMIADVKLRPEAEALVTKYASKDATTPSVDFHKTDISDWGQIASLWKKTLETFGRVDIVVNGAGVYEPPSSTFWNAPGISPLAEDEANASPGVYHTFSAAIASFVRSLGQLRKRLGIRNAAVCPGAVYTPIFHPEYCRDRVHPDNLTLTPEQCASVMMSVLKEPQYGDGNIIETLLIGSKDNSSVNVREVPLEALYPTVGPVGQDNHLLEEEEKLTKQLQEKGMRQ
ncbi:hypothetical protein BGZ61DRAFT_500596 [Ilyonectria robusta]|uniref:uncharacterized protein n=1 Tax=Ilyonectria robusta TaxID=1079257 RepID=UPI001E8E9EF5|nr:uncharacterized protein BGZ61DRAFT_500596 [Ilyonectria robusta]KAH8654298.1 hypothetical protein BGZ61DRAFT_500596 [Ilyonectria robusta]